MVKPVATTTNMTITLQQQGDAERTIKPLVVSKEMVVHTNTAMDPILPYQPVASEQNRQAKPAAPKPRFQDVQAGLTVQRDHDDLKLREFSRERMELLSNRY